MAQEGRRKGATPGTLSEGPYCGYFGQTSPAAYRLQMRRPYPGQPHRDRELGSKPCLQGLEPKALKKDTQAGPGKCRPDQGLGSAGGVGSLSPPSPPPLPSFLSSCLAWPLAWGPCQVEEEAKQDRELADL